MAQDDEFIREVDEEYRRDQLAQIWSRYSAVIVGAAILLVVAVGGWRYWQYAQERQAQAAATRYEEALRLSREEDGGEEARKVLEELAKEASGGYGLLTRFRLAGELGAQSAEEGAKAFDALAADGNVKPVWQDLARLRAAMLRLDQAEPAAVRPALERLATPKNPWRHSARELLGLSGLTTGDYAFASRWFEQIAADRDTPQRLRQRLEIYTALVAGGPVQATQ
jgi:hypothetical protein